jgi:hypothetical protein
LEHSSSIFSSAAFAESARLFFVEEMPALGQNFVLSQAGIELRDAAIESEPPLSACLFFLLVFSLMLPGRHGTAWSGLLHVSGHAYFSEGDQEGLAISLEFRLWRQEQRPKGRSSR